MATNIVPRVKILTDEGTTWMKTKRVGSEEERDETVSSQVFSTYRPQR